MKLKNVWMLLSGLFLFSCSDTSTTKSENTEDSIVVKHEAAAENHADEHAGNLMLNNGAKWQTDESTRTHAAKLTTEVNAFNAKTNAGVKDYQVFAVDMQNELNSLVSDCKMKGEDHDALHLWLEPVLKNVSDLKKVTTTEEGKHTMETLTGNLKKFNQYFN